MRAAACALDLRKRLAVVGWRPDIIIADYRLRGGRFGTEAVVEVRRRFGADVPGILLTGETGPEFAREAAAHGLAMLHKPVTPRQLSAILVEQAGTQRT